MSAVSELDGVAAILAPLYDAAYSDDELIAIVKDWGRVDTPDNHADPCKAASAVLTDRGVTPPPHEVTP